MNKKKNEMMDNPLYAAIQQIKRDNPEFTSQKYKNPNEIVDIMTFCNDSYFLDLPGNGLELFPGQTVILKSFYRGTLGNEDLKLTQEEWEWLYERQDDIELDGVKYERNIKDVIKKLHDKEKSEEYKPFTQLVLVLGRRGTKCRSENDLISTTEGSLTFRSLCDRINGGEKIGICTYDTKNWRRSVTYNIKAKDNGSVDCFTLVTSRGVEETSSWNHPYLVMRKNFKEPTFLKLYELRPGDKIAVADKTELFGNDNKIDAIEEWMDQYSVDDYNTKGVPEDVLVGTKEKVSRFLYLLFNKFGFSCINKYYDPKYKMFRSNIGCFSGSKDFLMDVRHLLQKFGIHAVVKKSFGEYTGDNLNGWIIEIVRGNCLNKFKHEIGTLPTKCLNSTQKIDLSNLFEEENGSDIQWDTVKYVAHVGKRLTVDLQVDPHHIIGGDIISHNTLMASIITAYEAYKLLVINNGDPHRYYNLPNDDEIAIINVALSQKQAGRLFGQVQARLRNSPFFKDRIAKDASDTIRLYTDRDLQKKKDGASLGIHGSIILLCGHSNPDSLAGYSAVLILFDEIAFYDETGKVTGRYFVNRLKPSLSKFYKYKAGKVVMISSPNSKNGAFYDAFQESKASDKAISDSCLSFQLPTWDINLDVTYDQEEMVRERNSNPDMFAIEYGAQWAEGGSYGNYFDEGAVDRCVEYGIQIHSEPHNKPKPGMNYYLHVDPAKKTNNYAAVLVGKERYTTPQGVRRNRCHLAGIWVWHPTPGLGLLFEEVDQAIIKICSIFHPMSVTYDDYHSVHSVQKLRAHGIMCKQVPFNNRVKCKLYQNLRNLMLYQPVPELVLYDNGGDSSLLISELKELKFKKTQRGFTIVPDKNGEVGLDDLSDCLAGSCSAANEGLRASLPSPITVRTGWV